MSGFCGNRTHNINIPNLAGWGEKVKGGSSSAYRRRVLEDRDKIGNAQLDNAGQTRHE